MKKIFILFAIALLSLLSIALAASYSLSFPDFPPSANVGSSFTAKVQVTNSSGTGSGTASITLTIDSTYFSTADSLTKTCAFSNSNTCTVTWSITALKSGTKTISAAGSAGSDTISSQSSSSIVITAPTSYTLTFTDNDADNSLSASQTVTLSLTVQNTGQAAAATATLSLTGFSLTSGSSSVSLGTIAESGQTSTSWTIQHDGSTASASASIAVTGGDTKSSSLSFSYSAPSGVTTTTTGTTGPGGGAPQKNVTVEENVSVTKIKKPELVPGVGIRDNTNLQAAIEKVLGKGKLSQQAFENLQKLSVSITSDIETTRNFESAENKSAITNSFKYKGEKKVKNFIVYEIIPKTFAASSDSIIVETSGTAEVVEQDPSYAILFPEISSGQEVSVKYSVDGTVSETIIDSVKTELYAESLEEPQVITGIKTDLTTIIILAAIILFALIIYFAKFRKR